MEDRRRNAMEAAYLVVMSRFKDDLLKIALLYLLLPPSPISGAIVGCRGSCERSRQDCE